MTRYYGCSRWSYRFCGKKPPGAELSAGIIEIPICGVDGGYAADEGKARLLLRRKFGVRRLPAQTQVFPVYGLTR